MTDEEKRYLDNLKQILERAKNYGALDAIEKLEKENERLNKILSNISECFISTSINDDIEMASAGREIKEILAEQ